VPTGFTQQELVEIGCIAEQGFVFHPYDNANRGTPADINSVHKKNTQWEVCRKVPQIEKDRAAALASLNFEEISSNWSAAKRRCFTGQVAQKRSFQNSSASAAADADADDDETSQSQLKKTRVTL
jgi:hypothetical protein